MIGLGVHSFLEGMILSQPPDPAFNHHSEGVLLGIISHKIPAAFSLMALLYYSHLHAGAKRSAICCSSAWLPRPDYCSIILLTCNPVCRGIMFPYYTGL